jgi:hypothetical protein
LEEFPQYCVLPDEGCFLRLAAAPAALTLPETNCDDVLEFAALIGYINHDRSHTFDVGQSNWAKLRHLFSMGDYAGLLCPLCHQPMKLVHIIPALGALSEIHAFYCADCKHAETKTPAELTHPTDQISAPSISK